MSKEFALVNPIMIKWVREKAGFSISELSSKLKRPSSDIESWENGSLMPTIAQAQNLAKICKRSFAILYMSEPPKKFQLISDYRRLTAQNTNSISFTLSELINTTSIKQEWIHTYLSDDGAKELDYVGIYKISTPLADIMKGIYKRFNISPEEQINCKRKEDALKLWITKLEEEGIFVFRNSIISTEECRGFSISDKFAPFIFINSNDAPAGQLFSLLHELAHILINKTAISNSDMTPGKYQTKEIQNTEVFCNQVASLVIMNPNLFDSKYLEFQAKDITLENKIKGLSIFFKVSEECVARRLLDKNIINKEKYNELRKIFFENRSIYYENQKQKRKLSSGGPSYYLTTLIHNGVAFTRTAIDAYYAGKLLGRDASILLKVKINNIQKLALEANTSLY